MKPRLFIFEFFLLAALALCPAIAHAVSTTYATSWAANSLSGIDKNHIPQNTYAMYVTPSGVVYTASGYEEGSYSEIALDTNGNLIGTTGGTYGGYAVAVDGSNQWTSVYNDSKGEDMLIRYPLGTGGSLSGQTSYTWDSFQAGGGDPETQGLDIRGMVINGTELYICDDSKNQILAFNTSTLHTDREWSLSFSPGAITVDSAGRLWVVERIFNSTTTNDADPTGVAIHCFTPGSGSTPGTEITSAKIETANVYPAGLAFDSVHNRLLVADNGQNQQIIAYTNLESTPTVDTTFFNSGTFGYTGGIYAGPTPGLLDDPSAGGTQRLHALSGVGIDTAGNIYVSLDGHYQSASDANPTPVFSDEYGATDIRKYSSNGTLLWSRYGNGYTQAGCIDPGTDGADLYTMREHYSLDLDRSVGNESTFKGYTVGRFGSPYNTDPLRSGGAGGGEDSFCVRLSGQPFLIVGGSAVYRKAGELWYPCGYIYRTNQYTLQSGLYGTNVYKRVKWYDANGDGIVQNSEVTDLGTADGAENPCIDANGNWWVAGTGPTNNEPIIHMYTYLGLDGNGAPQWSNGTDYTVPSMFVDTTGHGNAGVVECKYDSVNDVMYLCGYNSTYPYYVNNNTNYGSGHSIIARFNSWSTGNRTAAYTIVLPRDTQIFSQTTRIDSFDIAGNYIFAQSGDSSVIVYDLTTGSATPIFTLSPGPEVGGYTGANDNYIHVHAFERSTGEYLVVCEENLYNKVIMYRWNPNGDTAPQAATSLTASPGNEQIQLNWTAPTGTVTSYNIYRGLTSGSETLLASQDGSGTSYTDSTVTNGTKYYYFITATNAAAEGAQSNEASATPSNGPLDQINCGGPAVFPFVADEYFVGGTTASTSSVIDTSSVADPAPESVYQTQRTGPTTYTIPNLIPNAAYTVRLHFAEDTFNSAGSREFDLALNGIQALNNYDIYASAGNSLKAVVYDLAAVANSSGQIILAFTDGAVSVPAICAIEVENGALPTAATPVIGLASGTYSTDQTASITESTSGTTIYYTTDNTTPTVASAIYTGPISVTSSEVLSAIAIGSGYVNSSVATATYAINQVVPTAAPTISPDGGSFTTTPTATISDTQSGAVIYYTINGTTPTVNSIHYTAPFTVSKSETVSAIAVAPTFAVSSSVSAAFTVTLPAPTPTVYPNGGTFATSQQVYLSDSLGTSVNIYYSTNAASSSPTWTLYSASTPLIVSSSETLTFYAGGPGYSSSAQSSAVFTIENTVGVSYSGGLQLLSLPYTYAGMSPDDVFGYSGVKLAVWDPSALEYNVTPNAPANYIVAGQGYWIRLPLPLTVNTIGTPAPTNNPFEISLQAGWNMIGDPFTVPVTLSSLTLNNGTETFSQATNSTNALIYSTVYAYSNQSNSYYSVTTLTPGLGYWIYAYGPAVLDVPAPAGT